MSMPHQCRCGICGQTMDPMILQTELSNGTGRPSVEQEASRSNEFAGNELYSFDLTSQRFDKQQGAGHSPEWLAQHKCPPDVPCPECNPVNQATQQKERKHLCICPSVNQTGDL